MKGIKIKGFSNYWIFPELGKVWSIKSNRWIGSGDGYKKLDLYSDDGTVWKVWLHRLIWESVNGDIPQNMVINHKDETPSNCAIWNLEVCTRAENNRYGTARQRQSATMRGRYINRKDLSKQVERCDLQGNVLEVYPSTNEAGRQGFTQSAVQRCCQGKLKTHKGFRWRYAT